MQEKSFWRAMQTESTDRGQLRVDVTSMLENTPLEGAKVSISYTGEPDQVIEELTTDESGQTETVELMTPPIEYSLEPSEYQPYSEYNIHVDVPGFESVNVSGSELLANETSIQPIRMIPLTEGEDFERIVIPAHTLFGDYPEKIPEDEIKPVNDTGEIVLSRVVVPEYVVVHDGVPSDSTAANYYVRYRDYIKNVACSEIYSTWPDSTIRANVLAIMSFTLNRVYTEWCICNRPFGIKVFPLLQIPILLPLLFRCILQISAPYGGKIPMIKSKAFYKTFFSMWIILILQNIITLSVNLADNIMLGAYSEASLAGVAAANQIQFVYQQIIAAIGEGVVVLATQYYGKKQMGPIRTLSSIGIYTALAAAALLFLAVSLFPRQILRQFVTDQAIIEQGAEYLRVIRYTYLFFAITQLLLAVLRSMGIVHIALILSICTLLINCGINYTLIYGHFGAPRLGVTGAAIGTLTARIFELLVLIVYFCMRKKEIRLQDHFHTDPILCRDYFRVMLPLLLANSLWGLNSAMQNAILGHMTDRAITANSVASTLFLMVKSTGMGSSSAAAFFVGKTIGEDNKKRLAILARTLQILFVGIGIVSGISLYFLRIPILSLYKLEPETMAMADTFLVILSVVCVGMSYQMPTNIGIIRGGGDTKYVMKMDLISIWGIVIPLSFVMAFWVKASPVVVVCCLNADQIFKCVPAFLKCNFGHWAKKLTR